MASNRGAPTLEQTKAFQKRAFESKTTPGQFTGYRKPTNAEAVVLGEDLSPMEQLRAINSTKYPTREIAVDPRDTKYNMKMNLAQSDVISAKRPMPFTEEEINYLMDKASQEEFAAYDQWISERYDLNDMATKTWFKQIYPSYFERRKEFLEEQMRDHAKYARLVFDGPESEDDLFFQWTVESGRRHIPTGPFYDPFNWMQNEVGAGRSPDEQLNRIADYNYNSYNYGMFNPLKPSTIDTGAWAPNSMNQSDLVGNPNKRMYGFLGANPPQNQHWGAYGVNLNQANLNRPLEVATQNTENRRDARINYAPRMNYGRVFRPVNTQVANTAGAFAAQAYSAPTRVPTNPAPPVPPRPGGAPPGGPPPGAGV